MEVTSPPGLVLLVLVLQRAATHVRHRQSNFTRFGDQVTRETHQVGVQAHGNNGITLLHLLLGVGVFGHLEDDETTIGFKFQTFLVLEQGEENRAIISIRERFVLAFDFIVVDAPWRPTEIVDWATWLAIKPAVVHIVGTT
jgi:hypothetical protein